MVPPTRRALLASVAATGVTLAGCSSESVSSPPRHDPPENADLDPASVHLRHDADTPPIWYAEVNSPVDPATDSPEWYTTRTVVANPADRDRLQFADVEGADAARRFAAETDLETETLYLESKRVEACFRHELCHVTWSSGEIDTDYGRYYRDADVACELDVEHRASWLVRIPDALDPEAINAYGSGLSGSGCHEPRWARVSETSTANGMEGPR
jgi:hypothetical protein